MQLHGLVEREIVSLQSGLELRRGAHRNTRTEMGTFASWPAGFPGATLVLIADHREEPMDGRQTDVLNRPGTHLIPTPAVLVTALLLMLASCDSGGSSEDMPVTTEDEAATTTVVVTATTTRVDTTDAIGGASAGSLEITEDADLVYLTDDEGDWGLRVFYPETEGPWPLIVVIPPQAGQVVAAREMAQRGAVTVVADAWTKAWSGDPAPHVYGEMNRAVCIVGWAQAHAADYGASAKATTVAGYSGGAMAAAWAGLGLADGTACPEKMTELPVALVLGESQFLFHHERWDPAFRSEDPEPKATLDGLFNPQRWNVSPDLRVALWSAEHPIGETRSIENPPAEDSWIWLREAATPVVDDLIALGAFDDERVDWADNARLMELRMQQAGIDVQNVTYDIGHEYTDEVYDLIFSIQP